MPKHVLMSDFEIITDGGRRRRWSATEKLRIVEETLEEGASLSVVARRNGVAPNLLYRWRRLMLEGGSVAVSEDDDVTSNRVVRQLEERILRRLDVLDAATAPEDMNLAGFDFHGLKGHNPTRYTVHVNGPWCITFEFRDGDA